MKRRLPLRFCSFPSFFSQSCAQTHRLISMAPVTSLLNVDAYLAGIKDAKSFWRIVQLSSALCACSPRPVHVTTVGHAPLEYIVGQL